MFRRPLIVLLPVLVLAIAGCSKPPGAAVGDAVQSHVRAAVHSAMAAESKSKIAAGLDPNPSPAVAKSWAAKWCDVKPGMTRAQVRAIMGEPTDSFDLASGSPQMSWYAFQYGFTAFMDADDRVRQLDVNGSRLTDAEKSAIRCDFTRTAD